MLNGARNVTIAGTYAYVCAMPAWSSFRSTIRSIRMSPRSIGERPCSSIRRACRCSSATRSSVTAAGSCPRRDRPRVSRGRCLAAAGRLRTTSMSPAPMPTSRRANRAGDCRYHATRANRDRPGLRRRRLHQRPARREARHHVHQRVRLSGRRQERFARGAAHEPETPGNATASARGRRRGSSPPASSRGGPRVVVSKASTATGPSMNRATRSPCSAASGLARSPGKRQLPAVAVVGQRQSFRPGRLPLVPRRTSARGNSRRSEWQAPCRNARTGNDERPRKAVR
jgi:hypothetical protein